MSSYHQALFISLWLLPLLRAFFSPFPLSAEFFSLLCPSHILESFCQDLQSQLINSYVKLIGLQGADVWHRCWPSLRLLLFLGSILDLLSLLNRYLTAPKVAFICQSLVISRVYKVDQSCSFRGIRLIPRPIQATKGFQPSFV
jgi:hypothetical protein